MINNAFRGLRAAGSLLLVALATACTDPGDIGNELPTNTDKVGVTYVDTFTVRTSTVLLDSSATSTTDNLLVGRYEDPRLGVVEGKAFARVGLGGAFTAAASDVYDSLVVTLGVDAYRYGDTTRVQQLRVHRLQADFVDSRTYYTSDALAYDEVPLGERTFRARPQLRSLRIRLGNALGRELFALAQNNQLNTQADLLSRLKGLAITSGSDDNASIVNYLASSSGTGLQLYYHTVATPGEAETFSFTFANGAKHFYQLRADRRNSLLRPLTASQQALSSSVTAGEAYVQAGLGLYTKVELPYLNDLRIALGSNLIVVSAELALETVNEGNQARFLPPLTSLTAYYTDRANRLGTSLQIAAPYRLAISPRTSLEQGSFTFPFTTYVQTLLSNPTLNTGLLLAPTTNTGVTRLVLGGQNNVTNPARLRVYFARVE